MTKSGIAHPKVVDVVVQDAANGRWKLILVETSEWVGSPDQLLKLQEKLNNYLIFALDGEMARVYPESAGKPVVIQIDSYSEPDEKTREFLSIVRGKMRSEGIELLLNVKKAIPPA